MDRITKVNTKPERIVRSMAHRLGYRFRLHRKDLPGTPDLTFPRFRKVIFVHGCFWHRHSCKHGQKVPSGNHDYWLPKFERNTSRDARQAAELIRRGWKVLTLWECELGDAERLRTKLTVFLSS
jgi:DNA mismatch endonuclease (patch repair protein)